VSLLSISDAAGSCESGKGERHITSLHSFPFLSFLCFVWVLQLVNHRRANPKAIKKRKGIGKGAGCLLLSHLSTPLRSIHPHLAVYLLLHVGPRGMEIERCVSPLHLVAIEAFGTHGHLFIIHIFILPCLQAFNWLQEARRDK